MAALLAKKGVIEKAATVIAFTLQHPATTQTFKEQAASLYEELVAPLTPEQRNSIWARGRALKLEKIIAEITSGSLASDKNEVFVG